MSDQVKHCQSVFRTVLMLTRQSKIFIVILKIIFHTEPVTETPAADYSEGEQPCAQSSSVESVLYQTLELVMRLQRLILTHNTCHVSLCAPPRRYLTTSAAEPGQGAACAGVEVSW